MSVGGGLLVLDASAALAFILPSQSSEASDELFRRLDAYKLTAPHVFLWETLHVLARHSLRSGRKIEPDLEALDALEIEYQPAPEVQQIKTVMKSGVRMGLSIFDAAYLALALDLDAPLATRDAALVSAAERIGAPVLDLR